MQRNTEYQKQASPTGSAGSAQNARQMKKSKPNYEHGVAHKGFENKLNQDFDSAEINQKWCTDFTYLFLTDGSKRYNCTIIDLHDRSVIASVTDRSITADLAKRTLEKAIKS